MNVVAQKISAIDIDKASSWGGKVFITFDVDWVCDEILFDTLALIREHGNPCATFFVTHDSPLTQSLRDDATIELGLHPNFNPLLDNAEGPGAEHIIQGLQEIVPEAVAVRSHSLTQSSWLCTRYEALGIKYECSCYLPFVDVGSIRPWQTLNGLTQVPHVWEDDVELMNNRLGVDFSSMISPEAGVVFDFHPIHIYLNTHSLGHYEVAKPFYHKPAALLQYRQNDHLGVRDKFIELLSLLNDHR